MKKGRKKQREGERERERESKVKGKRLGIEGSQGDSPRLGLREDEPN